MLKPKIISHSKNTEVILTYRSDKFNKYLKSVWLAQAWEFSQGGLTGQFTPQYDIFILGDIFMKIV